LVSLPSRNGQQFGILDLGHAVLAGRRAHVRRAIPAPLEALTAT
jgi:hypothetical protein